jgi:hypothetical protein
MKTLKCLIVGIGLVLTLATKVSAQVPPPPPPWLTNFWATNIIVPVNYTAIYSNNLASVSGWLHDTVTNVDGTPATSMQSYADLTTTTFSTSGAFSWVQSMYDSALTFATFNGLPTEIDGPNGNAYLVGFEGTVPEYIMPYDVAADITISTTNVWPGGSAGFTLTGTNRIIGQWDEGLPLLTHAELTNRISIQDGSTNLSDHSTAVGGMLIGAGVVPVFSNGVALGDVMKGMAYQAKVQAWSFINDAPKMTGAISTNHIRLSNHSYGAVQGWFFATGLGWFWYGNSEISTNEDPKFGNYTTNAQQYDVITLNAPTYLQVWASGNSLSNGPPVQPTNHYEFTLANQLVLTNLKHPLDGDPGGYNSLSQEASAKDILTVGAVNPLGSGYSGPTNLHVEQVLHHPVSAVQSVCFNNCIPSYIPQHRICWPRPLKVW